MLILVFQFPIWFLQCLANSHCVSKLLIVHHLPICLGITFVTLILHKQLYTWFLIFQIPPFITNADQRAICAVIWKNRSNHVKIYVNGAGMILSLGVRGPKFDYQNAPPSAVMYFILIILFFICFQRGFFNSKFSDFVESVVVSNWLLHCSPNTPPLAGVYFILDTMTIISHIARLSH